MEDLNSMFDFSRAYVSMPASMHCVMSMLVGRALEGYMCVDVLWRDGTLFMFMKHTMLSDGT